MSKSYDITRHHKEIILHEIMDIQTGDIYQYGRKKSRYFIKTISNNSPLCINPVNKKSFVTKNESFIHWKHILTNLKKNSEISVLKMYSMR